MRNGIGFPHHLLGFDSAIVQILIRVDIHRLRKIDNVVGQTRTLKVNFDVLRRLFFILLDTAQRFNGLF